MGRWRWLTIRKQAEMAGSYTRQHVRGMLNMVRGIVVGLLWAAASGWAGEFHVESAGLRSGFHATSDRDDFRQTEAFANWNLPLCWELGADWAFRSRLDLTAGWLTGRSETGFVGTAGPAITLGRRGFPLVLEGGVSPTMLSRDTFGSTDLGCPFQFTLHAGLNWQLGAHFDLSYRYQHMSNAALGDSNPGLNLHMFALGYRF